MKKNKAILHCIYSALAALALILLFFLLRGNTEIMNRWTFDLLRPFMQNGVAPILADSGSSIGEILVIVAILFAFIWIFFGLSACVKEKTLRPIVFILLPLGTGVLWIGALFCWTWNCAYYADNFQTRAGIETPPYSVETLAETAEYFAIQAAHYSLSVQRDDNGDFAVSRQALCRRGRNLYAPLADTFPQLSGNNTPAKTLSLSYLQSLLGFTGVYFPLTGEANVNVHFPAPLLPATIAHELAHQHLIASENEANFLAIVACSQSKQAEFQYSGYLLGLIELCNALYPEDPLRWNEIVNTHFTPQMTKDWNENNAYWKKLSSPVEKAANQVYDAFLKGNDQPLGIKSYGACVDLVVAWFHPQISTAQP